MRKFKGFIFAVVLISSATANADDYSSQIRKLEGTYSKYHAAWLNKRAQGKRAQGENSIYLKFIQQTIDNSKAASKGSYGDALAERFTLDLPLGSDSNAPAYKAGKMLLEIYGGSGVCSEKERAVKCALEYRKAVAEKLEKVIAKAQKPGGYQAGSGPGMQANQELELRKAEKMKTANETPNRFSNRIQSLRACTAAKKDMADILALATLSGKFEINKAKSFGVTASDYKPFPLKIAPSGKNSPAVGIVEEIMAMSVADGRISCRSSKPVLDCEFGIQTNKYKKRFPVLHKVQKAVDDHLELAIAADEKACHVQNNATASIGAPNSQGAADNGNAI